MPHQEKTLSTNPLTGTAVYKSNKPLDLRSFTKEDVKEYFNNSYSLYETLFTSLKYDYVYYFCPDRLRLPLIFYYGHTAAVFINKLVLSGLIEPEERVNLEFETTFETGVDEMSWDDTEHYRMGGEYKWPTVPETKEYRLKVRELINKVIDRTPLELPVTQDSKWWAFFLGFEHERIHFETSTVLIRQYPIELVKRPIEWQYGPLKLTKDAEKINNPLITVPETNVRIGKDSNFPSFGWDNEYGRVDCKVSAFEASKYKVTNEEFLEFVLNDGYNTREFWSDEGWEWVQFKQARHPLFWVCTMNCKSGCGGKIALHSHCQEKYFSLAEISRLQRKPHIIDRRMSGEFLSYDENGNHEIIEFPFKFRLMFDVVQMPRNWPVECNYHEAKAFCKWKGEDFRMLSEAEEHAIRDNETFELETSSDIVYKAQKGLNHNMIYGSSTPVNMGSPNTKGFCDTFGNVWEWCEDHFNGLPGGKTHFLYDDFSTPCYDGRHNMIMGGSWASTGDEASRFARFMFRRHFYQHCGFRLARSLPTFDGSKPNPQFRLVADRIFILGGSTPENKIDLDESKLALNFVKTTNAQYYYDSILHQDLFDQEILFQHGEKESFWYQPFMNEIKNLLTQFNIKLDIATHIGCSTGRICFDLTNVFAEVVGTDFCGKFLDVANSVQKCGLLNITLNTINKINVKIDLTQNLNTSKAVFKQMTWIPNEVPKSDFVLFTMIDRVMNPKSWLCRLREIVKQNGLLVIQSRESKYKPSDLLEMLNEFNLVNEKSIMGNDSFTIWQKKPLVIN